MSALVVLPLALPLLAAAATALLPTRAAARRAVGQATTATVLLTGVVLVARTRDGEVVGALVAGWPGGIAIPFAADLFAALMITVSAVLVATCSAFARATGDDAHPAFVPLVLVMSAGAYAALLTGDLFTLFVAIEVMLVPSYVLLQLGGRVGRRERRAAGGPYVVVNLFASTLLLAGAALVYGAAGTVNLGELAGAAGEPGGTAAGAAAVLLALAIKAGVVPVHGWLPMAYPVASPAVTALFSGLLTKVGVYAAFRVYAVVFDADPRWAGLFAVLAGTTMVVGVLAAVGRGDMRGILAFHMVSQLGYLVVGLAVFTVGGVSATIFYLLQYVLVKAALFLCAGVVRHRHRTERLDELGGLAAREPWLAIAFLAAALSLVGLPPFSGFVAKLVLALAAFDAGRPALAGLAVAVSLLTLLSMLKIWTGVFWGTPQVDPVEGGVGDTAGETVTSGGSVVAVTRPATTATAMTPLLRRGSRALVAPPMVLAAASLLLGLFADPLLGLTDVAARGLLDPSAWVAAVSGR